MKRRSFFRNFGLASAGLLLPAETILASDTESLLKENRSFNQVSGKVTSQNSGITNVSVSDGYTVVQTNAKGQYNLTLHPNAKFVFIALPSGYAIPTDKGIAQFYIAVENIKQPKKVDFKLNQAHTDDTKHSFIVWADPQIRNQEDAAKFLSKSVPDTVTHINQMDIKPAFGIGCGDLIWDKQELFKDYKQGVATTGIPFWQAIGNHDMEYKTRTDEGSGAAFQSHFGPTYYSFNKGKVHYVILDDVFFIGNDRKYIGYLTEDQLHWLEQDLHNVTKGSTVVIALHIPTQTGIAAREHKKEEALGGSLMNREALYNIVKDFQVTFISGHTHFNEIWEKDNMREHVLGTLCGAWWTGPFCGDGTPAGFSVFEVENDTISWYYKSTGYDKEHQIRIIKPGTDTNMPEHVFANIWNYDAKWTVTYYEDGKLAGAMEQFTGYDPEAYAAYYGPELPSKRKWVEPIATDHLFVAKPKPGTKKITIKATDRFGNTYSEETLL